MGYAQHRAKTQAARIGLIAKMEQIGEVMAPIKLDVGELSDNSDLSTTANPCLALQDDITSLFSFDIIICGK